MEVTVVVSSSSSSSSSSSDGSNSSSSSSRAVFLSAHSFSQLKCVHHLSMPNEF